MTLDSCLRFSWDLITAGFMERFLWFLALENEGGNLFSFDAAIDRQVEPQLLCCQKLPISPFLNYFRNFVWILQERVSSLFFVGFIEVVKENNTSVVCGQNWYFFRVHYKTDYPSDNSGQPCLKEGPTKHSLFSVKPGSVPPKIPFFKSWTRF